MVLLIDDIKLKSQEIFLDYMDNFFPDVEMTNLDQLYEALCAVEDDVEVIISDYDEIPEESKKFARQALEVMNDVRSSKKNYKITRM